MVNKFVVIGLGLYFFINVVFILFTSSCRKDETNKEAVAGNVDNYTPYNVVLDAKFVGGENCVSCHKKEHYEWLKSDHHKSMNIASKEFVLGNFNNYTFKHFDQKYLFYMKNDQYWVNIVNKNNKYEDFKIEYTFGHYPLQQYLVADEGGKYQALQVCWDSRTKNKGGQKWFHIYPNEKVPTNDPLHWKGKYFNWNSMCADCHSTNLRKNFDFNNLSYNTSWSDINVNCESCHGPGSEHIKWGKLIKFNDHKDKNICDENRKSILNKYSKSKGLVLSLKEPKKGIWIIDPKTNKPKRNLNLKSNVQIDTCAPCHSHREKLDTFNNPGKSFLDTHSPSVLRNELYHHDGQIKGEVYVYGSFIQSKMFKKGVRCTDCHNPHSMKLKAPGNSLCLQCHQSQNYNTSSHHFHQEGSPGASCVECHMPSKIYMGVDSRRDHNIRIPRPDLSNKLNSQDACTKCHNDKPQSWIVDNFVKLWEKKNNDLSYGEILQNSRKINNNFLKSLNSLINNSSYTPIVRATGLSLTKNYDLNKETIKTILDNLKDKDPLVRSQALLSLIGRDKKIRKIAIKYMDDPIKLVRISTVRVLADIYSEFSDADKKKFNEIKQEYLTKQEASYDRASGHLNTALLYSDLGDLKKSEQSYKNAIKVEPKFIMSYIALSYLFKETKRIKEAKNILKKALDIAFMKDNKAQLRYEYSKLLIGEKKYDEAMKEIKESLSLNPKSAQINYFYAVALNSFGNFSKCISFLEKAMELAPYNREYLLGSISIFNDAKRFDLSMHYAELALVKSPNDTYLIKLINQLKSLRGTTK